MKARLNPRRATEGRRRLTGSLALVAIFVGILIAIGLVLPTILALDVRHAQDAVRSAPVNQFPVSVDPRNKTIVENAQADALFNRSSSPLIASVGDLGDVVKNVFDWLAVTISDLPFYPTFAAANSRLVAVTPGMRKEQVASAFASALSWNSNQKQQFLTPQSGASLPLVEGSFAPGIYAVSPDLSPVDAQALVNKRFEADVLEHYGTTTAAVVPLGEALTVASLIEREAAGADDRRIISGIIWNRLFIGMNLQIDATLQYAKANTAAAKSWWPKISPNDLYRKSPYNTYQNPGLPPGPIANPSVASILAALNPVKTSCLFYFHDSNGRFHCSDTYKEHVVLLKKYYGRGK